MSVWYNVLILNLVDESALNLEIVTELDWSLFTITTGFAPPLPYERTRNRG